MADRRRSVWSGSFSTATPTPLPTRSWEPSSSYGGREGRRAGHVRGVVPGDRRARRARLRAPVGRGPRPGPGGGAGSGPLGVTGGRGAFAAARLTRGRGPPYGRRYAGPAVPNYLADILAAHREVAAADAPRRRRTPRRGRPVSTHPRIRRGAGRARRPGARRHRRGQAAFALQGRPRLRISTPPSWPASTRTAARPACRS